MGTARRRLDSRLSVAPLAATTDASAIGRIRVCPVRTGIRRLVRSTRRLICHPHVERQRANFPWTTDGRETAAPAWEADEDRSVPSNADSTYITPNAQGFDLSLDQKRRHLRVGSLRGTRRSEESSGCAISRHDVIAKPARRSACCKGQGKAHQALMAASSERSNSRNGGSVMPPAKNPLAALFSPTAAGPSGYGRRPFP